MAAGEASARSRCPRFASSDLFPTKTSVAVFVSYMALFINQGILVTATKKTDNTYDYNPTTVVLFTECLKLLVCCACYGRDHSIKNLAAEIMKNRKVFALYLVPALLYCVYNNLSFLNLAAFDPTTYFLLLQFRVVVTGILFQILFKKNLSMIQWISLVLLTFGCIIKEVPSINPGLNGGVIIPYFTFNLPLILMQVFCSCFAGVYNEYLLKHTGVEVPIMLQNIFMYVDSVICNLGFLTVHGELLKATTADALREVLRFKVLLIVANSAAIGIVTSFFLHSLNSILKTFASALEIMFTAVLCWLIFDIPIDRKTVVAIAVVSLATYLYSQNPVVNKPKSLSNGPSTATDEEKDSGRKPLLNV